MSDEKRPLALFHEAAATELTTYRSGITGPVSDVQVACLALMFRFLQSKMPVAAGHKLAEDNVDLPMFLRTVGQNPLIADVAQQRIDDLRDRKEEKKQTVTPASPSSGHDEPRLRGN